MPRTPADTRSPAPASDRAPRAVLAAGVVVTAVAALALVGALIAYATGAPGSPLLFRLVLFGFPLGFALMLLHLVLAGVRRRRL